MATMDIDEYRQSYLKEVQDRITAKKDSVEHFTSSNLHHAIMQEMNRADDETWEVEVPDDRAQALDEAEARILETMKHNTDLGTGKSF